MTALITACGFPRPPDVKGTNLPVGGNVHGMWTGADGVALRLTADGVDTLYTVTANGPFAFPSTLGEDVSYAVTVVSSPGRHTCAIQAGAAGVVGASGVGSIDVACTGPAVTVALSTPAPWTFDPTQQVQPTFNASVVLQDVTVTVGSPDGQITSVQVAGSNVSLGQASPPQVLALGANMVRVGLTAQGGLSTTYQLAIDRGAGKVAQWTYGKASNTGRFDGFGTAVAIDGDTLVVSAGGESSSATTVNGDQNNDNAQAAGAAYVFRRSGERWVQEAYLKAFNAETFDDFGVSVAISSDTIAVGAFGEDSATVGVNGDPSNNNANHSGAVYVYRRSGTTWSQEAYIKASNTGQQDNFGFAVALSGNTLAVGAYGEASPTSGINQGQGDGAPGAGAVYVFQRVGSTWSQQAYIKASNTQQSYYFGFSVALDGDTLAVGSKFEASSLTGVNPDPSDRSALAAGAVYLFTRTSGMWTQQAYIKASNTRQNYLFGNAVSLSHDTLAIGSPGESSAATGINGNQNDFNAMNAGAVYVFFRTNGTWTQQSYIKASNTKATDEFGYSVSVLGDTLLVGSHLESNSATGVDGNPMGGGASASGAAYVFERAGTTWSQRAYLKASNTGQNDQFGNAVAVSGDTLVVAAPDESSSATGFDGDQSKDDANGAGAIYLFR
jgi:uncharacterized membrane protein